MKLRLLAIATAAMILLSSGCATTPTRSRDRIGDFVSNVATALPASGALRG